MDFFRWAALVLGGMLLFSGARAIRKRDANVVENIKGQKAVWLGWLWIAMGFLFLLFSVLDSPALRTLFRTFLEAP
ncbi:MAG: hypothetical protein ACYDEQ_06270 [Desulfocucumaceae bacterium]